METYLGDGLYASFDGYMITLRAPRMEGDHWVGLEPEVFAMLEEYAKQCWSPKRVATKEETEEERDTEGS